MWWRDGVLYQIYPRSFADSNGDGVGDLRGIIEHLDHLAWLGIEGLWMNPTFPSPNADWGFDVSDYRGVHPELGTLEDLDELVARAGELGIRVLLDLVPNHTSDEHPWFRERRDYYVWREGQNGAPPNNWMSLFGGPAWTRDDETGLWYLHNFDPKQPDLDWWNDDVRAEFDDILRFWFDRGIAGFRIDVAHGIVKDRELRDNPPATEDDSEHLQRLGQRPVFSMNRPEVHDVLRRWRKLSDPYDAVLVGETYVLDVETLATFYGADVDELHLAFNFVFLLSDFSVAALAPVVAETEARLPEHAWPVWTLGNHDITRYPTRWGGGDARLARCALMLLMTLRGTPVVYYGDELAMPETYIPPDRVVDPDARRDTDHAGPRRRSHADAVARRAGPGLHAVRRRALAAVRRGARRRRRHPARGPRLAAVAVSRPHRAAPRGAGPADGRVCRGQRLRRGLVVSPRLGLPGGTQPRRLRCRRAGTRDRRRRHSPRARRGGRGGNAGAGAAGGRGRAGGVTVRVRLRRFAAGGSEGVRAERPGSR